MVWFISKKIGIVYRERNEETSSGQEMRVLCICCNHLQIHLIKRWMEPLNSCIFLLSFPLFLCVEFLLIHSKVYLIKGNYMKSRHRCGQ